MEGDPVNNLRRHRKNRHCGSFSIVTGHHCPRRHTIIRRDASRDGWLNTRRNWAPRRAAHGPVDEHPAGIDRRD